MVEHAAVERFGGAHQAARSPAVGRAWPAVATGMIVGEQDSRAAALSLLNPDSYITAVGLAP